MRSTYLVVGVVGLLILAAACGGDDKAPNIGDAGRSGSAGKSTGGNSTGGNSTGGKSSVGGEGGANHAGATTGGKAATGGSLAAAGAGGEGGTDPGTPPTVTILSPETVTDPLGGKVLVADAVDVVCKVVEGAGADAAPVDPASVKIAVLDAAGAVVSEKDAGLTVDNEYTASVPLTAVASGKITLRCSAESTSNALGTSERSTLADRGPLLTLVAPPPASKIALKDKLKVSFTAAPRPLGAGDDQADVNSVELKINGVHIDSAPVNGTPGAYTADVDFSSAVFQTKPNGETSFSLTAADKRAPVAAVATLNSKVVVDGSGPVISVAAPTINKLVGGFVTVSFTITDALSGVNSDSIVVTLNEDKREFDSTLPEWTVDGSNYTYKFDSRGVTNAKVQINITISANDNVGNATSSTTIPTYLDNIKPQVDLDPLPVRSRSAAGQCSRSLDPVGDKSLGDYNFSSLKVSSGYDFVRVLAWDKTNQIIGSPAPLHFAGIDQSSVRVYFQNPGVTPALLVNSKAPSTGACDEIGDTSNSISMTALQAMGAPWYTGDNASAPLDSSCTTYPAVLPAPSFLCLNNKSDLWHVVTHAEGDLSEPAVYARTPSANTQECTGSAWDVSSLIAANRPDGFVCFAARAVDKVGNVGISPPIRVCVDTDLTDDVQPNCAKMSIPDPPSCTDGCTPPARGGGVVVSGG